MKALVCASLSMVLCQVLAIPVRADDAGQDGAVAQRVLELSKAIDANDKDRFLLDERATAFLAIGKNKEAVDDCTKAIGIDGEDLRAYHLRSIGYKALGQLAESKADEEKLALLASQLGDRNADREIAKASEQIKANPKDSKAYSDRASLLLNRKDFQHALEDCTNALRLDPKNKSAYLTRMGAYVALHRDDQAKADKAQFDSLDNADRAAFSRTAVKEYSHFLNVDAKNTTALEYRAQAYMDDSKYREAIQDLTELIRLKPDYAKAFSMRGDCYQKLKEQIHAQSDYKRAKKLAAK